MGSLFCAYSPCNFRIFIHRVTLSHPVNRLMYLFLSLCEYMQNSIGGAICNHTRNYSTIFIKAILDTVFPCKT